MSKDQFLRYYRCGETSHNLAQLFKGGPKQQQVFPSGAFLFQHSSGARVLFDTGYAPNTAAAGWKAWLYSRLLPPVVAPDDLIGYQLRADKIHPASITHVVLSHLHPDHIGGVRHFPEATFYLGEGALETLRAPKLKEGFFPGLLPQWFWQAPQVGVGAAGLDLFGDGSYRIVPLPGHARGQVGAVVGQKIVLAGDAAWGRELLGCGHKLRPVPRHINHDLGQYQATEQWLLAQEQAGLRLCFSHDTYPERDLL